MKEHISLLFTLVISYGLLAQSQIDINSVIKEVTVYRSNAQITRIADVTLNSGSTVLVFDNLPSKLNEESIQVEMSEEVNIVAISSKLDHMKKLDISKEKSKLFERKRRLKDSIEILNSIKGVYLKEKQMILKNQSIGGTQGVSISELNLAASFFRERLLDVEELIRNVDVKSLGLKHKLVDVSRQLMELSFKEFEPVMVLKVTVGTSNSLTSRVKLSYVVPNAGWTPGYDVRVKDIDHPLSLIYKAKVYQSTGEDWKDVQLTLSTGNPSISNQKPELIAYQLTYNNYYRKYPEATVVMVQEVHNNINIRGMVKDATTGEPLIGANLYIDGTAIGTVSDINGAYEMEVPMGGTLICSYMGYEQANRQVSERAINFDLRNNGMMMLEEVVVNKSLFGQRTLTKSSHGLSPSSSKGKKKIIPLAIQKGQITSEFKLNYPTASHLMVHIMMCL